MKQIASMFLLAGIFLGGIDITTRADVLDNWTTNQITTNSFGLRGIVYGNGRCVAVGESGDYGQIYTSTDGLSWTACFLDYNGWGMNLNYSDGHFSGVGGWGYVDVSTNGIDWTSSALPSQFFDLYGGGRRITYGNGLYVTVGSTNGVGNILTSPDGVVWTSRTISPPPGGPIANVVYGNNRFIAVGINDGFEYTSIAPFAGTTWTRRTIPGGSSVSYGNGLFFVPLTSHSNLVSTDGINWSLSNTGLTNYLDGVFFANGLFMGWSGTYLATSVDGNNWVQYSKPLPGYYLATDGTRLVTVAWAYTNSSSPNAYNGFVYTSDILVDIRSTNAPAHQLALSGLIGRNYQIQSADELPAGSNGWHTNFVLQLPNTPYVWTDGTATNSKRFYRGVLLP